MRIHFICRGNVLRSLIAETYLKSLQLEGVEASSSGTVTDIFRESDKPFFASTLKLLERHGIQSFAKAEAEQLTQARVDNQDITICMNQIVIDEAKSITTLPEDIINWDITDIGEGARMAKDGNRLELEDAIYDEIVQKVDQLTPTIQ